MLGGVVVDGDLLGEKTESKPANTSTAKQDARGEKKVNKENAKSASQEKPPENTNMNTQTVGEESTTAKVKKRRRNLYFDEDVDKKLKIYVAMQDSADMSGVVTEAIREFLKKRGAY